MAKALTDEEFLEGVIADWKQNTVLPKNDTRAPEIRAAAERIKETNPELFTRLTKTHFEKDFGI
jgi:hypothetical protein